MLGNILSVQKTGVIHVTRPHLKKAHLDVGDKVKIHRKNNTQFEIEIVRDEDSSRKVGKFGVYIPPSMTKPDYCPGDAFEITYGTGKLLLTWIDY